MVEQSNKTTVDVLVCTYKRPELLAATLLGVERAMQGDYVARIIVVDNDAECSARKLVESLPATPALQYIYLSQPVQNISLTRNRALDAAKADYIALIDDDEVPVINWLKDMIAAANTHQADLVFAPVVPRYEEGVSDWVRHGGFFDFRSRHPTGTRISFLEMRTGNVLLRGSLMERTGARFDPELGLSGGEDYAFFKKLTDEGIVNVWCDEAVVQEVVPVSRANAKWFLRRSFRIGSVDAFSRLRDKRWGKVGVVLLKASVLAVQGVGLALLWSPFRKHKCVKALQRLSMGLGIFYGLFFGPYSEYKTVVKAGGH